MPSWSKSVSHPEGAELAWNEFHIAQASLFFNFATSEFGSDGGQADQSFVRTDTAPYC